MSNRILAALAALTLTAAAHAQDVAEMCKVPPAEKEHQWLHQLEGEWNAELEASMGPGQPPMKSKGTESSKMLGTFFLISSGVIQGDKKKKMPDMHSRMTLGYDPTKKKYVGTWVSTAEPSLWTYQGSVAGNTLTLDATGPNMMDPKKTAQYQDSIELVDKNHKKLVSKMKQDDGSWVTFMTGTYTRKKK